VTLTGTGRVELITTHLLPDAVFSALAEGGGDPAAIRLLHNAQLSKHLMLLHAIAEAAEGTQRGPAAFRDGYELLARIQAADPGISSWLLGLPHLGGWAHDGLIHLERGSRADFGHFACLAAAAAVRAGLSFELDVPVRDGRVRLPGLGSVLVGGSSSWTRLGCDGERVTADDCFAADRRLLVPDDGSGDSPPGWAGTPMVRAAADGLAWTVLLETGDPYLDRYTLPMSAGLSADELGPWRDRVRDAWEILVRHHRWAAEPIAAGLSVIVPLTPHAETDLVSATTPAAFGAIATSWPTDPVTLAETLVHEFQHVKLCGLLDLVLLTDPGGPQVYAPWRQDPRPAGGLLQGVYAHLGIVRFWRAQQHAETDPDGVLRAQVLFARWGPTIDLTVRTLLQTGSLTPLGARFVSLLRAQGQQLAAELVPPAADEIAREVALDHRLTWQARHVAVDAAGVADLAAAYRGGEPFAGQAPPRTWIQDDVRKVDSTVRSRLLNMRYLEPERYRQLCADGILPLSEADRLLVGRSTSAAVRAYCAQIAGAAGPQPGAWIGLALALHRQQPSSLPAAFGARLPLMIDVHARLSGRIDPLDLTGWFT
jgi:HEXXH motif-containing protein